MEQFLDIQSRCMAGFFISVTEAQSVLARSRVVDFAATGFYTPRQ
jgi:hypothetical protein